MDRRQRWLEISNQFNGTQSVDNLSPGQNLTIPQKKNERWLEISNQFNGIEPQNLSIAMPNYPPLLHENKVMASASGVSLNGQLPSQPVEQPPQVPDFRYEETGSFLPYDAGMFDNAMLTIQNMLTGDDETKLKNIKKTFKGNFVESRKTPQGEIFFKLKKFDYRTQKSEIKEFSLNNINRDFVDYAKDAPEVVVDAAIFYLGSKGLGSLGGMATKIPYVGPAIKTGFEAASKLLPTATPIVSEGIKAGITEFTKETIATEGDTRKATYDAGTEGVMSIVMDTVIAGATRMPYLASKLPTMMGGDVVGSMRKKVGELVYGSFGGDKAMGGALGALPLGQQSESIIRTAVDASDPKNKIPVNKLAQQIVKEMPIADAEKAILAKNVRADSAELIIAVDVRNGLRDSAKQIQDKVVAQLAPNGVMDENTMKISQMDPLQFINGLYGRKENWQGRQIMDLLNDYIDSPSPFKTKPSELINKGLSTTRVETLAHAITLGSEPKTIQEYVEKYNKALVDEYKKLPDGDKRKKEIPAMMDIDNFFKSTDEKTKWLKEKLGTVSLVSGAIGAVGGGMASGGMASVGGGAVSWAGAELLGNIVQKNPKATIDAIKHLAMVQKAGVHKETNLLVSGLSAEELVSAKRFLATKDMADFTRYLGHTVRRQSELRQSVREYATPE
jgi:hypothetical protein